MADLRLLTYNVKLLPDIARASLRDPQPFVRGASTRSRGAWWEDWMPDATRAGRLASAVVARGYDIVCLQEVFDEGRRRQLVRAFEAAGYACLVPYSGDGDLFHEDSGLLVASKCPIRWSLFEEYADTAGSDGWSDKGVSWIAINVGRKLARTTLVVFHTHLQAHDTRGDIEARTAQVAQLGRRIRHVVRKLRDPSTCAAVVCGDFNIRAETVEDGVLFPTAEYENLCRALHHPRDLFRNKKPAARGYTSDSLKNRKMKRGGASGERKRLDYVFAIDSVEVPGPISETIALRKLKCTGARVEPFYDAPMAGHLSDHFGVEVALSRYATPRRRTRRRRSAPGRPRSGRRRDG